MSLTLRTDLEVTGFRFWTEEDHYVDVTVDNDSGKVHFHWCNLDWDFDSIQEASEKMLELFGGSAWEEAECVDEDDYERAVADCPHGEPLHYHHDGCPSCYSAKDANNLSSLTD